jgi:AmmeMemoRadiSam system protein A
MKRYEELLKLARGSIASAFENRTLKIDEKIKKKYSKKQACFVTLTINEELRGCIGSLDARQELWKDVASNALNAAFSDPRFNKLNLEELKKVKIEISILSVPTKIEYNSERELKEKILGKGVVIKKGWNQATYLPQVWEQLSGFEEFISSLCEKADLSRHEWKKLDLEVKIYRVDSVEE